MIHNLCEMLHNYSVYKLILICNFQFSDKSRGIAMGQLVLTAFRLIRVVIFFSFLFAVQSTSAGIIFSGSDTPVDRRGWLEVWENERNTKIKRFDKMYFAGKNIYLGKGKHNKYNYCIPKVAKDKVLVNEESYSIDTVRASEKIKLKTKTIAAYRGLTVNEFANVLFDCDNPNKMILNKLEKEDAGLVIYYLNSKYRLRLQQPEGGGKLAKNRSAL